MNALRTKNRRGRGAFLHIDPLLRKVMHKHPKKPVDRGGRGNWLGGSQRRPNQEFKAPSPDSDTASVTSQRPPRQGGRGRR
jgi:hypothetical protein